MIDATEAKKISDEVNTEIVTNGVLDLLSFQIKEEAKKGLYNTKFVIDYSNKRKIDIIVNNLAAHGYKTNVVPNIIGKPGCIVYVYW